MKLLICVDCQNDFMQPDGALYVPGAEYLIKPINKFINSWPFQNSILYTYDTHNLIEYAKSDEAKQFPIHCVQETQGWELSVNRSSAYSTYQLYKSVFDMWQSHVFYLGDFLGQNKYKEIHIIGVASDYCVKYAINGFVKYGYKVITYRDLTKGIIKEIDEVAKENWPNEVIIRTAF